VATETVGGLTITPKGIWVGEDPERLARQLPLSELKEDKTMAVVADRKKVFVIHGRNLEARHEMGVFLRSLGLEPVWFRDVRKNMGGTAQIIRVVEQGMKEAHGVLALVTPDEFSVLRPPMRKPGESGEAVERWQARPNVLFEAGMAYMRDPDRVAFVLFGEAKLFTDTAGMCVFWPTNDHGPESHRTQLRDLLGGGMHCDINDGHDWMTSGDFDAVIRGLSGVSPRDPFRTNAVVDAAMPSPPPPDLEALRVFLLICGLPKVATSDWDEARRESAKLHAHLGGGTRGAYIATTAYAWYCKRDVPNRGTRREYQAAQEEVERQLRNPSAEWEPSTYGIVAEFARSAAENIGNPLWLRL
jgi:predicted nucleotide-binding protein